MARHPALLAATGLQKAFATQIAVDGLDLEVRPGEIFALLGPNGAGKTTTVRMLTGLLVPDAGAICYRDAHEAVHSHVPPRELGYLPEERGLYLDQPVLRQLVYFAGLRGMAKGEARRAAHEGLERLGLSDRAGEKAGALSKGNQQKVQLLAALLHRPRFAILDEPFSGFDPVNQELALTWFREIREQGTTILLSAHQMALVERIADQVLLMAQGRSVRQGSVSQLRAGESAGTRMLMTCAEAIPVETLMQLPGVLDVERLGGDRVALMLDRALDLNTLLASLSQGPRLTQITTEDVDLHTIYLRSVRAAQEAPCAR